MENYNSIHKTLKAKKHIDLPEGFRCRFITSDTENEVFHNHEYYEIFLTLSDNVSHYINGQTQILKKGSLVFIRPQDIHLYTHKTEPYTFINLAFSEQLAEDLFQFLEDCFPVNGFLTLSMPPSVTLLGNELVEVKKLFHELLTKSTDNSKLKTLYCKTILCTLFTKYFFRTTLPENTTTPLWLSELITKMQSKENFLQDVECITQLSGKTYEHLSRSLKKYYNITPTELINDLRLNYAANLLKYSNKSITDICFECGFKNTSWFFTCFKKKYEKSPLEYRKNYKL